MEHLELSFCMVEFQNFGPLKCPFFCFWNSLNFIFEHLGTSLGGVAFGEVIILSNKNP